MLHSQCLEDGKVEEKIDIAKNLLSKMVDSLSNLDNLEIALRVYGHKIPFPPKDCEDSYLEVNFLPSDIAADLIKKKLSVINQEEQHQLLDLYKKVQKIFQITNLEI